jgi:N-acetyl-alpha-D-glucosaminyl L-malate synthase BshA
MKIGITCYPTYGGSGVVGTELGIELAARGHEIHFITSAWPMRLRTPSPLIHFHDVEAMTYPLFDYPPYALALATKMAEVAELAGLDLLHVHYAIPHSVSAHLAREMMAPRRLPFITTLHGTDITLVGMDGSYRGITKFAIEKSDAVTAISTYLQQKTYDEFHVKNEVRVIYNFVNCQNYRRIPDPDFRARFAPNGEKILVHLSNFRPVKRVTDVVETFALVREKINAKLLMVGDGPDRSAAEMLAHRKGIYSETHFLGKQDNVDQILSNADVLLLPSEMESFGLAALEAMACEVPPIASRVGGVPELISHGENGFLAEVGDVKAMAGHAIRLLSDDGYHQQVAAAARQTALTKFCTTLIIPQYEALYRSVLEKTA